MDRLFEKLWALTRENAFWIDVPSPVFLFAWITPDHWVLWTLDAYPLEAIAYAISRRRT